MIASRWLGDRSVQNLRWQVIIAKIGMCFSVEFRPFDGFWGWHYTTMILEKNWDLSFGSSKSENHFCISFHIMNPMMWRAAMPPATERPMIVLEWEGLSWGAPMADGDGGTKQAHQELDDIRIWGSLEQKKTDFGLQHVRKLMVEWMEEHHNSPTPFWYLDSLF